MIYSRIPGCTEDFPCPEDLSRKTPRLWCYSPVTFGGPQGHTTKLARPEPWGLGLEPSFQYPLPDRWGCVVRPFPGQTVLWDRSIIKIISNRPLDENVLSIFFAQKWPNSAFLPKEPSFQPPTLSLAKLLHCGRTAGVLCAVPTQ